MDEVGEQVFPPQLGGPARAARDEVSSGDRRLWIPVQRAEVGIVARGAIDGVALIGWIVDRLPLPGSPVIERSGGTARASCQPV